MDQRLSIEVQVSLGKSDALVAKNPSGLSRIRVKEGYFSRISRVRRPKIVQVIEDLTYRSPTYQGTTIHVVPFAELHCNIGASRCYNAVNLKGTAWTHVVLGHLTLRMCGLQRVESYSTSVN